MAGYLDNYGESDGRREKIFKYTALMLVTNLVVGGFLYFWFKNYPQERQAKRFFEALAGQNYRAAYALWGCAEESRCPDYPFTAFMEDWGPGERDPKTYRVLRSRSCGSGVILTVDTGRPDQDKLWVEREELTMGYSPYPGCPPGR
jgi:hypothetical protein